jgi:hypothetical protein
MKCHWTSMAMIGLGIPLVGIGTLLGFSKRRESRRNLGIMAALLGLSAILVPTTLIGVCANPDMICNSVMRPTLILTGTIVAAFGVGTSVFAVRQREVA